MTQPLYVLNGPNLNRLGVREPEIYGHTTLAEVKTICEKAAGDVPVAFHQSNIEGEIVNWIHSAIDEGARAIVINPAGLTFTSVPILDALKMFPGPVVEFHISNIHQRDPIYHNSLVSKVATAVMAGLGAEGYAIGVQAALALAARK